MKQLLITIAVVFLVGCGTSMSLHTTIKSGNTYEIKQLFNSGRNLNANDKDGWIPLHFSIRYDRKEMFNYLISNKANINIKDSTGKSPLSRAVIMRSDYYTKNLLFAGARTDTKDKHGLFPLQYAVWNGDTEIVDLLLEHKAQINLQSEKTTLMHIACMNSHESVAKLLIKKNANLNAIDSNNRTPLDISVSLGDENIIEALIKRGAKSAEELKAEGK